MLFKPQYTIKNLFGKSYTGIFCSLFMCVKKIYFLVLIPKNCPGNCSRIKEIEDVSRLLMDSNLVPPHSQIVGEIGRI